MSKNFLRIPVEATDEEWRDWVRAEGQELLKLGIPKMVVESQYFWADFVEHGCMEKHGHLIDFSYEMLDPHVLPRLLEILLASYPSSEHGLYDLILVLWRIVKPNEEFWDSLRSESPGES